MLKTGTMEYFEARTEAALTSGSVEQRLEKLALFTVQGWRDETPFQRMSRAEEIERFVHYERPASDPRT